MKTYLIFYSTFFPALITGIAFLPLSLIGNIISLLFGIGWSWMLILCVFLFGFIYRIIRQFICAIIRKRKGYVVPPYQQSPVETQAFGGKSRCMFGSAFGEIYCNIGLNFMRSVVLKFHKPPISAQSPSNNMDTTPNYKTRAEFYQAFELYRQSYAQKIKDGIIPLDPAKMDEDFKKWLNNNAKYCTFEFFSDPQ